MTGPPHYSLEGTFTLNSDGTYALTLTVNVENATPQIQQISFNGTYTVAPDGTFTLDDTFTGKVTNAGKSIVLAQTSTNPQVNYIEPEIIIATRMGGTYSNAMLNGTWAYANYFANGGSSFASEEGPYSFNGNGVPAMLTGGLSNSDGTVVQNTPSTGSWTYSVSSTGVFTMTQDSTGVAALVGNVSAGGDTITAAVVGSMKNMNTGMTQNGQGIIVMNKTSGTYTNASAAGSYTVVDYGHGGTSATSGYQAEVSTLTINSNGTYSWNGTTNLDGNISPNVGTGTYTLNSDGTFVMHSSSGHISTGSFGDSGNSMTGASVTNGQSPGILVGYKNTLPANTSPAANTLNITNSGNGTITSSPAGIDCGSTCSATYTNGASVTLTATPASGSTFAGWSGACTGTGACVLSINAAKNVTATFNPVPFTVATTGITAGIITAPIATVTATIAAKAEDVGKTVSVFITAMMPPSAAGTFGMTAQALRSNNTSRAQALAAPAASSLVLMNLTSSGWQPVVNGVLIPYTTEVLGDQLAAITILNNANTASLGGSQFCVGYGASVTEMNTAGRMQLIATIPDPNAASAATASCILISDARVFAYAEANYSDIFAGTPAAGQAAYQGNQYDYRYYPGSQNYLAVDTSGMIYLLGPYTSNAITPVGQVESFRSYITAWEATH